MFVLLKRLCKPAAVEILRAAITQLVTFSVMPLNWVVAVFFDSSLWWRNIPVRTDTLQ